MYEIFYIPKTNQYIAIEYEIDKKQKLGYFKIIGKDIEEKSEDIICSDAIELTKIAYKKMVELLFKEEDNERIYLIKGADNIFSQILESKYELLDETKTLSPLDSYFGTIKRIFFHRNKIVKVITHTEEVYIEEQRKTYSVETFSYSEILKNLNA